MAIPLTRYGRREVVALSVMLAALTATAALSWWPTAVLPVGAWVWVLWFFRDPQRTAEPGGGLLAPADGRVVEVAPLAADGPLGRSGVRVSIFMSLLDVHVNRCPLEATVSVEHRAGGFVDARRPEAAERNESTTIRLAVGSKGAELPLIVRQVAGLVARRIVTDLREGQPLAAGQRIGMIKFGSRVELLVPTELVGELAVRVGQKVRGGQTVLIRLPARSETA